MTYEETVKQLEALKSEGKIKDQTVEVVSKTQKYFIHHFDVTSEKLLLRIDRTHYTPMSYDQFVEKLKDVRDMINSNARVEAAELGKIEGEELGQIFCSDQFVELIAGA